MVDNVLIMAGGAGTRLWPASIRSRPKQFMDPGIGKSLLRGTIDRALALGASGKILVVTNADHVEATLEECRDLEPALREHIVIIGEPIGRNTAPAIALGLAYLRATAGSGAAGEEQTTLVLAADHLISPTETFVETVEKADALAREGLLVTFGVEPTRPETGYGYIEAGQAQGPGNRVAAFREKPDRATAERYLETGGYYWNSGMFVFPTEGFFGELEDFHPEIAGPLGALDESAAVFAADGSRGAAVVPDGSAAARQGLEDLYAQLPSISVDYALMEKSSRSAVVPAPFSWSDIGSWDEIAKLQEASGKAAEDDAGRPTGPPIIEVGAAGNTVLTDLPVAICGVEDLIVVQRNGKLLICRRGQSQMVKEVVQTLKEQGREEEL